MTYDEIEETLEEIVEMLNKIPSEHIVINYKDEPVRYECKACGKTDPLRTHIEIGYFLNLSYAFRMSHLKCAATDKDEEKPEGRQG